MDEYYARKIETFEAIQNLEMVNEALHRAYLVLGYSVHDFDNALHPLRDQVPSGEGIGRLKAAARTHPEPIFRGLYVVTQNLEEYIKVMKGVEGV